MGTDDVSEIDYLFLIKNYRFIGNTFVNLFGNYRVMVVGKCAKDGNFKSLKFCFTTPEEKDESLFTVWLLSAFVNSIAPAVNSQTLMDELTAENSSGEVVKDNVRFSILAGGNLNILTATPNQ